VIPTALVLAVLLPTLLWLSVVGDPRLYVDPSVPSGQLAYVLSKLAGLCALGLFALQLTLMVLRGTALEPAAGRWGKPAHRRLGLSVVALIVAHVALFIAAASLRSDHLATHLLLPRFESGFYDAMVSLGVLALYVVLVLVFAGALAWRRAGRQSRPRGAHRLLALASVPLIAFHSYAIGSETSTLPVMAFYALLGAVALVGLWRTYRGARR